MTKPRGRVAKQQALQRARLAADLIMEGKMKPIGIMRYAAGSFREERQMENVPMAQEQPSIYGENAYVLKSALQSMYAKIELIRSYREGRGHRSLFEHYLGRIKSEQSMAEKLRHKGLAPTFENAVTKVTDAVGVRIVCRFVDDVYDMADIIKSMSDIGVVREKDYIKAPKPNGYRSYHLIVMLNIAIPNDVRRIPVEIQLRTIAQDCWAALEHELKYKRSIVNVELIQDELKRCADEMASTDLSMLTVRQMIFGEMKS